MIISWPGGVKDLGEVAPATCPSCRNHVATHLIRTQDTWALYFIAIAPFDVNEYRRARSAGPDCRYDPSSDRRST